MSAPLETNPTWLDLKTHAEAANRLNMLYRWGPRMLRISGGADAILDSQPIDRQQAKHILDHIRVEYRDTIANETEVIFERDIAVSKDEEMEPSLEEPIPGSDEIETENLQVLIKSKKTTPRPISGLRINDIADVLGKQRESLETRNVLGITVYSDDEAKRIHSYINQEVEYFFHDVVKETPTGYIPYELSMAPASDLKVLKSQKEHSNWFYDQIFCDFGERDQHGKLVRKLKFFITLDEESSPMQIKHFGQRGADPRRYGTIDVGGGTMKEHRVCYIVYFTLQELLNAMKQKT